MRKRNGLIPFIVGVLSIFFFILGHNNSTLEQENQGFEEFQSAQKESLQKLLNELESDLEVGKLFHRLPAYQSLYKSERISLFILKSDELFFWNEEESPLDLSSLKAKSDFIRTPNSLHFGLRKQKDSLTFIALEQIGRRYPYQNSYLKTELSEEWIPYLDKVDELKGWSNEQSISTVNNQVLVSSLFLILGLILLCYSIPLLLRIDAKLSNYLTILLILLVRTILFFYKPDAWTHLDIFKSTVFSYSFWGQSSADLLINSFCLILISYLLIKQIKQFNHLIVKVISFFFFLFFSGIAFQLIFHAVLNSQFSFELDNIFKLEASSLLVILSVGVLLLNSLLFLKKAILDQRETKGLAPYFIVLSIVFILHQLFLTDDSIVFLHAAFALVVFALMLNYRIGIKLPELLYVLMILLCLSSVAAILIERGNYQKENSSRRVLLQKLAEERDPLLEYLFTKVQDQIRSDDSLVSFLERRWEMQDELERYLRSEYLNGYWDRYRINFTLCSNEDSILVGGTNINLACFNYFQDRIYNEGDQISAINLFQLSNLAGRIDYIGEIQLSTDSRYKLYMELSRDYFSEDLGYPELFLNNEDKNLRLKLDEYSYAVYFKDELINSEGDHVYKINQNEKDSIPSAFYTYQTADYSHTRLNKNENITIILSKKKTTLFANLSRVTYLLVIFGILFLGFSLFLLDFPFYQPLILTDFSTKIRLLISSTLLLALVLFLAGTTYYIKEQYKSKNSKAIEEKLRSISLELDQKLGDYDSLNNSMNSYVTSILIKFSNVFYTDINLYDSKGQLYASSRPELFKQDLKSRRMNPMAYASVIRQERSKLVQNENIGELGYLSAYIPFKNRQNELLAYLNLPYFARQEELNEEISTFLTPTINSYVIIFTLALLISFLLINQISKPLLLIRKHISGLKFGSSTDLIEWQSSDEIGELVREYNRIAIELGQSAEELAKSEREGAWREMAKQIAHEIKNPLTPMKLSVQHLQRYSEEDGSELKERIKKTSETLISQIESLTAIAEAFTSFAKFPEKDLQDFELLPLIKDVSHLYVDQAEINISPEGLDGQLIKADKDLVLRIFNNLIKNAIQANDKEDLPTIDILMSESASNPSQIEVSIRDYGKGISEEQSKKIFEPSFTTKSSGTGLGLAIVKRSLEQIGGDVRMSSKVGEGTSFVLYFPKA